MRTSTKLIAVLGAVAAVAIAPVARATPSLTFQGSGAPPSSVSFSFGLLHTGTAPTVTVASGFLLPTTVALGQTVVDNLLQVALATGSAGTGTVTADLKFALPAGAPDLNVTGTLAYLAGGSGSVNTFLWHAPTVLHEEDSAGDDYTIQLISALQATAGNTYLLTTDITYVPEASSLAIFVAGVGLLALSVGLSRRIGANRGFGQA
jgi:hypothetical protein